MEYSQGETYTLHFELFKALFARLDHLVLGGDGRATRQRTLGGDDEAISRAGVSKELFVVIVALGGVELITLQLAKDVESLADFFCCRAPDGNADDGLGR